MNSIFRTILPSPSSDIQIDHQSGVICMGSCFAEHIGNKLSHFKFPSFLNPFGIIYNPISLAKGLEILLDENFLFEEKNLFQHLGGWHSFQHHGSFSNPEKELVLKKINSTLREARIFLAQSEFLILTLGTSNVFIEKNSNHVVANCHKVSQENFFREMLAVEDMVEKLSLVFEKIKSKFPKIKIISTVSPVRHIRDGLVKNQISKSKLILTLHELAQKFPYVDYFPSYELLLDDLRNYRFYKKDMIHPNEIAIDYIWEYFSNSFFSEKTKNLNEKIEKIKLAAAHRPFHPQSESHLVFQKNQLSKIEALENEFSYLNFKEEKNIFLKKANH